MIVHNGDVNGEDYDDVVVVVMVNISDDHDDDAGDCW
jgi:hypothetical protein